jgi:hypothetical protein
MLDSGFVTSGWLVFLCSYSLFPPGIEQKLCGRTGMEDDSCADWSANLVC